MLAAFANTSAFRFALIFLALFCGAFLALFAILYTSTVTVTEQQTRAIIEAEIRGLAEQYRTRGLSRLAEVIAERSADEGDGVYLLVDGRGRPLEGNLAAWPEDAETGPDFFDLTLLRRDGEERSPHAVRARAFELTRGIQLLVGRDVEATEQFRRRMIGAFFWSLGGVVLIGLLGGWLFSRRMLSRVDRIAVSARRIMDGSLSERIDRDQSGDEFDRLSARLNDMLERNEQLMTGMRLVTDSMAHDLKGPLTRLKARIELALRNPPTAGDDRAALEEILGESERALGLFDGLIKIAEAESGISRADFSTLDLCDLVPGLVELYEPVAEERSLSLRCDLPASLPVFGHAELLSQSLANLLDNAIKYVPAGGEIGVTGHLSSDGSMISVSDNGPGVPEADRDRIVGRFARLDKARSTPGSGLGLSLVSAVAKLHGARLVLEDNNPGLVVRITYPPPEQGTGKP